MSRFSGMEISISENHGPFGNFFENVWKFINVILIHTGIKIYFDQKI